MSIKKDTIAKYVRHLNNLGCTFKIIEDDGTEHGTLDVVRKTKFKKRFSVVAAFDYRPQMRALDVGEVVTFTLPEGMPIESLRSALTGFAAYTFGPGKVVSSVDRKKNTIDVMRME